MRHNILIAFILILPSLSIAADVSYGPNKAFQGADLNVNASQVGPWSVNVPNVVRVTPSTEAFSINGVSYYRTDSYAAPGSGPVVNVSSSPLRTFSIEVFGGTTWDVNLEGSLDGTNFTMLLNHITGTGDGITLFSGTSMQPSLYLRSRVVALTGGPIAVTFVGVQ